MKRLGFIVLFVSLWVSPARAFPDNVVLFDFTGSDGTTPPSADFTNAVLVGATSGNLVIQDNAVASSVGGTDGEAYWNPTTFGPDCEVYSTIVNVANTNFGQLYLRLLNIGANTTDGYRLEWADATSAMTIARIDNGVPTTMGATVTQTITTTDKVGMKAVGDQICLWYSDDGGAWTELTCRTDATYSSAGHIGIGVQSSSTTVGGMDDFGGGTVTRRRSRGF